MKETKKFVSNLNSNTSFFPPPSEVSLIYHLCPRDFPFSRDFVSSRLKVLSVFERPPWTSSSNIFRISSSLLENHPPLLAPRSLLFYHFLIYPDLVPSPVHRLSTFDLPTFFNLQSLLNETLLNLPTGRIRPLWSRVAASSLAIFLPPLGYFRITLHVSFLDLCETTPIVKLGKLENWDTIVRVFWLENI